jgi:hypothetical protein
MRAEIFHDAGGMSPRVVSVSLVLWAGVIHAAYAGGDAPKPSADSAGPLQSIDFVTADGHTFTAAVAGKRLSLEDPDEPVAPTVWDSPLQVIDIPSGKSCQTESWLINRVYTGFDGKAAVVVAVNAARRDIHFVDLATCKSRYPMINAYTAEIQVSYNQIALFPGCECNDQAKTRCLCQAARVYRLAPDYRPTLYDQASRALTRRYLGVEFTGEH